jgi:hypothetical protein
MAEQKRKAWGCGHKWEDVQRFKYCANLESARYDENQRWRQVRVEGRLRALEQQDDCIALKFPQAPTCFTNGS